MTRFFQSLLTAWRGSETNFTAGSLNRSIFLLAIPMILEMGMESLFTIVDVFFVAKIGTQAIATVGLTESLLTLLYAIATGLSTAASAVIARRIGENNPHAAGKAVAQVVLLSLTLALVLGLPGCVWAENGLRLMGASEQLSATGAQFTRLMFASAPTIMLLYTLSGCLRGAGKASQAMRSLWLANGLNIVLCPLLIFGWGPIPELGLLGSAVATTISRSVGILYQLTALSSKGGSVRMQWRDFIPSGQVIRNLLTLAVGSAGQQLIGSASWVFLTRLVATFGSEAVAGYTIALRIMMFSIIPAWGMGNVAATLVGQNLGAGLPKRAETAVWRITGVNLILLSVVGLVFYIRADYIVGFFDHDPRILAIAGSCLRVLCLGYGAYAINMVIGAALNGAGDTRTSTRLTFICFWLVQVPLAYGLSRLYWEASGVFWSVSISEMLLAVLLTGAFRRGRWQGVQV